MFSRVGLRYPPEDHDRRRSRREVQAGTGVTGCQTDHQTGDYLYRFQGAKNLAVVVMLHTSLYHCGLNCGAGCKVESSYGEELTRQMDTNYYTTTNAAQDESNRRRKRGWKTQQIMPKKLGRETRTSTFCICQGSWAKRRWRSPHLQLLTSMHSWRTPANRLLHSGSYVKSAGSAAYAACREGVG